MAEFTLEKGATPRAVRLTMPASVAYDLPRFQKSIARLLEELGCLKCFSGVDCTFQLERDWVINERGDLRAVAAGDPSPQPSLAATATLPAKLGYDIDAVNEVVARIADRLGCSACCSGFDITFRRELDFFVDQDLNINAHG